MNAIGSLLGTCKLGTMIVNANELRGELEQLNKIDGAHLNNKNDAPIISFGLFLRRLSISELPLHGSSMYRL